MTRPSHDLSALPDPPWMDRDGWFRAIRSFQAITTLMAHEAMHADLKGTFEALGLESRAASDFMSNTLLSMNGAEHKRFRSVVGPWFTPKAVEVVRSFARREAHDRLHDLVQTSPCDFVEVFARPYVVAVTAQFVGLPSEDSARYLPLVARVNSRHPEMAKRVMECSEGLEGLVAYARDAIAQADEGDGRVLSKVAGMVREGTFTTQAAATFVAGLLSAGNDPTINQVALGVDVLSQRPEVWDAAGSGEADVASIAEELLRYRPTNEQVSRRVAESFVHDGVAFTEGEYVIMRLSVANRDPDQFRRPEDFDPVANRGSHLAFGFGAHYCLGAALARLQLQEALRALTTSLECPTVVERDDKPPGGIVGPVRMVITVEERGRPGG